MKKKKNIRDSLSLSLSRARRLGPQLNERSADTRVLDILLLLRYLHRRSPHANVRLHIVGENQQDETSRLALTPRAAGDTQPSDFINTQAICARALVLTLAYPIIIDALHALFDPESDTKLRLVNVLSTPPETYWSTFWGMLLGGFI